MILPIYAYGQPVLKKKALRYDGDKGGIGELIQSMWATMYNAGGVGLAGPQVGKSLRIFVVDTTQIEDNKGESLKEVFINPEILSFEGEEVSYEEGCLSIPDVHGEVMRPNEVRVKYYNADLVERTAHLKGMEARVFQHEFDHLDGVLFIEKLKPIRRKRIQKKLEKIKKGLVGAKYKLKFV